MFPSQGYISTLLWGVLIAISYRRNSLVLLQKDNKLKPYYCRRASFTVIVPGQEMAKKSLRSAHLWQACKMAAYRQPRARKP